MSWGKGGSYSLVPRPLEHEQFVKSNNVHTSFMPHLHLPCHTSPMPWRLGKELVMPEAYGAWFLSGVNQL